jgi:hypothetical protein
MSSVATSQIRPPFVPPIRQDVLTDEDSIEAQNSTNSPETQSAFSEFVNKPVLGQIVNWANKFNIGGNLLAAIAHLTGLSDSKTGKAAIWLGEKGTQAFVTINNCIAALRRFDAKRYLGSLGYALRSLVGLFDKQADVFVDSGLPVAAYTMDTSFTKLNNQSTFEDFKSYQNHINTGLKKTTDKILSKDIFKNLADGDSGLLCTLGGWIAGLGHAVKLAGFPKLGGALRDIGGGMVDLGQMAPSNWLNPKELMLAISGAFLGVGTVSDFASRMSEKYKGLWVAMTHIWDGLGIYVLELYNKGKEDASRLLNPVVESFASPEAVPLAA